MRYEIRNSENISAFTAKSKNWKHDFCKCRICQLYVGGAEFKGIVILQIIRYLCSL